MERISTADTACLRGLSDRIRELKGSPSLEQAAQDCASRCYDTFPDSIVLVRVFATVPFGKLPPRERKWVEDLTTAKQVRNQLTETTPILALLGTRGAQPAWNDRRRSEGHVGIPLVSASFIQAIPMIARLLKELGLELEWVAEGETAIVAKTMGGGLSGVFYVPEARTAVDQQGRKIIAAQDFAAANEVQSVFGVGGAYLNGSLMVLVFFTREAIEKPQAVSFMPLTNVFKAATTDLVMQGKIFS